MVKKKKKDIYTGIYVLHARCAGGVLVYVCMYVCMYALYTVQQVGM